MLHQTLLLSLFICHVSGYRLPSPRVGALINRVSPQRSIIDVPALESNCKVSRHARQQSLVLSGKKDDVLLLDFDDSEFPPANDDLATKFFDILKSFYLIFTSFRFYIRDVIGWLGRLFISGVKVEGSSKVSGFQVKRGQELFVKEVLLGQNGIDTKLLPEGYEYFGVDDDVANLEICLQTNPFYASALKYEKRNFKDVFVCDSGDTTTWFGNISATLNSTVYDCVKTKGTFEAVDGKLKLVELKDEKGRVIVDETEKKVYTAKLLHLLTYFAESIHVNFHLFHYIMVTGLSRSVRDSSAMKAWARPYEANVVAAYVEAKLALLKSESGVLVNGGWVTGDRDKYIYSLRAMNALWGSFDGSKEFIEKFILKDVYSSEGGRKLAKKVDLLGEFLKLRFNS